MLFFVTKVLLTSIRFFNSAQDDSDRLNENSKEKVTCLQRLYLIAKSRCLPYEIDRCYSDLWRQYILFNLNYFTALCNSKNENIFFLLPTLTRYFIIFSIHDNGRLDTNHATLGKVSRSTANVFALCSATSRTSIAMQ